MSGYEDSLRSLMEIILEVMRFFLVCHQWEPLPSWSNPSYGSLKLAFGEMEPETPGVVRWLEGNLGSLESRGAECHGASVTSHAAVIKYPAGSSFRMQRLLFLFGLFLAYSLRDYSSLWQGRHKSKSVRQLSHCACSQDAEGWVLVPTGFLLCVESWTPVLRIVSPTHRVGLPPWVKSFWEQLHEHTYPDLHFTSQLESED